MLLVLVVFAITLLAAYVWFFYEDVKRYPKGPTPFPFIGNLLSINFHKLHEVFVRYSKQYGNVFTIWLPKPYVVIMDFGNIKEAFLNKGDDFCGRSGLYPDTIFQNVENGGVIFSQGDNWREQRRISLHILRDFGMGKNLMEEQVLISAQEFLAHLSTVNREEGINLSLPIQVYVANIINRTLFGFGYEYNNCNRLLEGVEAINSTFIGIRNSKLTFIAQMFPSINSLPILRYLARERFDKNISVLHKHLKEDIERALNSYSVDQEPDCFVQAYYQKMQTNPHLNWNGDDHYNSSMGNSTVRDNPQIVYWFNLLREPLCANISLEEGVLTLLQNYKIQPVMGGNVDMSVIYTITLLPKEQPLCLTPVAPEIK
ncbi:unspecific monooxygenase [Ancylostoma ceylanicum]|uniref:Unspecific monooxygenase n=1 Tax=Ancylostoma ceylanicum TaxID=53326 RepID=A0A0D6LZF6_9BILA|nr:unspecific monooxygenase [Ancylostoma ceylanicum]